MPLGIIDRLKGVAVGLLASQVLAHRLGVTILRERAIGARRGGQVVHPIAALLLREQPATERLALTNDALGIVPAWHGYLRFGKAQGMFHPRQNVHFGCQQYRLFDLGLEAQDAGAVPARPLLFGLLLYST